MPALAFLAVESHAQNPVPNPSFDIQTGCPQPDDIDFAPPWISASNATPDLFNSTCPTQNLAGHTGIGAAGVYVYGPFPEYREYMQAPLTSPLVAGQGYCVSVWVKRANFKFGTDRFGLYFSPSAVSAPGSGVLAQTPQVQNTPGNILAGTNWQIIQGAFTAVGGEAYITIGNFANDASTTTQVVNAGSTSEVAYYYVDDVLVTPCNVGIQELDANAFLLYPQPVSEHMTLQMAEGIQLEHAMLTDASGRLVRTWPISTATSSTTIDVHDVPEGSYHLILRSAQGTAVKRVMIAR